MSVERITAEMATAAEREHLEARIVQLELEVRQLRNALATILDAAATGIAAPDPTNHSRPASEEVRTPDHLDQQMPADLPRHRSGG
jgi:outer membrane protein TolC